MPLWEPTLEVEITAVCKACRVTELPTVNLDRLAVSIREAASDGRSGETLICVCDEDRPSKCRLAPRARAQARCRRRWSNNLGLGTPSCKETFGGANMLALVDGCKAAR